MSESQKGPTAKSDQGGSKDKHPEQSEFVAPTKPEVSPNTHLRQDRPSAAPEKTPSEPGPRTSKETPAVHTQTLPVPLQTPKPRSTPRTQIDNLEQFIALAYTRKSRRVIMRPQEAKRISQQPRLGDEARERLLAIALTDVLLTVPRHLLLVARNAAGITHLRSSLREFVGAVLRRHPVFSSEQLRAALDNLPDAPDTDRALAMLAHLDYSQVAGLAIQRPLTKAHRIALRTNATCTLALWFTETRGLSIEKLVQDLFISLWRPDSVHTRNDSDRARLLTDIRDLAAVGLACQVFKTHTDDARRTADAARKAESAALEQLRLLETSVDRLEGELGEQKMQIDSLHTRLEQQKQKHENDLAHVRDDYERLRSRFLRRLKADVLLLDEGLHALRRDPPNTRVMDDHAERALDGLNSEIRQLESGG